MALDYSRWDGIDTSSSGEEDEVEAEQVNKHIAIEQAKHEQDVHEEVSAQAKELAMLKEQLKASHQASAALIEKGQSGSSRSWMLLGPSSFIAVPTASIPAQLEGDRKRLQSEISRIDARQPRQQATRR
mmetsp:Transcript_922/g.2546  ORF Transcript_922/g.2546 Transcript_922/m.2546 type:complete len:129 (+) Transcript_922:36-422(+)